MRSNRRPETNGSVRPYGRTELNEVRHDKKENNVQNTPHS
jgi:hypothetical protein